MSYLSIFVLVLVMLACTYVSASCPPPNKVFNDKPTCFSDADCQKWGKICCRNQHNTKSCVDRAPWSHHNSNKQIDKNNKYSGVGGGGILRRYQV